MIILTLNRMVAPLYSVSCTVANWDYPYMTITHTRHPDLYFYPGSNQTGSTIEVTNGWTVAGWNFVADSINSATGLATDD